MSFTAATRRRMLLWAGVLFVLLLALAALARLHVATLDDLDGLVGLDENTWRPDHEWVRNPLVWVSRGFNAGPMLAASLLAAALLASRRLQRAAAYTVAVMVASIIVSALLKVAVGRPRPALHDVIIRADRHSLPSGHSAYIAAAAGIAIVLAQLFLRRRSVRRLVAFVAVGLALIVGLDRLLLGAHSATDVLAGYSVGALCVLVGAAVFDPAPPLIKAEPLASPVPSGRNLACILNPIKVEDVRVFQALVEQMALESGWSRPTWYFTTVEDPGRSMAEEAAVGGADLVLVCGGDGTVRTVCGELAGTGVPVGVIPAGTGNLLARNLDLPLYLRSAIDVGLNGQDRAIDIVQITGDEIGEHEHYLVMAGMGFDAAIMEGANEQLKEKIGWLAYIVSGLRNLMFTPVRVEISVDDGPWTKHRARTIVIGNVGNLQGGLPLLPDATIDDGTIDLVLLYPRRFLSWLRVVVRVLSRNKRSDETVTRMTGRKISVRASSETPRQIDGDSIGAGREITCEVLAGKLLIRAPR